MAASDTLLDPAEFRRVLAQFATGVTVVTTELAGEVYGMTANAVAAVSLEPLLVLVCLHREARITPQVRRAGAYTLSILSADQQALSDHFAGRPLAGGPPPLRFETWQAPPRIAGCLGAVGCRLEREVDGGDHVIALGRVTALYRSPEPGVPLLFFDSRYRRLPG